MSKNEWKKSFGVVGRMLLAFAVIFGQCAFGQNQKSQDKAAPPTKASAQQAGEKPTSAATTPKVQTEETKGEASENTVAEEKPSSDGSHEGIKVHGHWTIEVRNPDGTLVTHREFENSLVSGGTFVLTNCLVNGCPQTPWSVLLVPAASNTICSSICTLPATASITFLTSRQGVALSATVTAAAAGAISQVETSFGPAPTGIFTIANITPVAAAAGQIIQVSVLISFS